MPDPKQLSIEPVSSSKQGELTSVASTVPGVANISLTDKKSNTEKDIDSLISGNRLALDAKNFDIADKLMAKGVALPYETRPKNCFTNFSEYLNYLAFNMRDLYIALRNNPKLINEQDELGKTILHYAAEMGLRMGSNSGSLILYLLFNTDPKADFSIKDKEGNTPVHIAASRCDDEVTCFFVFPNFVKHAAENGFNFSILNNNGHAVIHLAALLGYVNYPSRYNTIEKFLDNCFQSDIDILSSAGGTAFFYAINNCRLVEAHALLDAGADPLLFGTSDCNPLKMVDEFIASATKDLFKCKALIEETKQKPKASCLSESQDGTVKSLDDNECYDVKPVLSQKELETKQKNLESFITEYESLKIRMLRIAEASIEKTAVTPASVSALVAMTSGSTTLLSKDSNSVTVAKENAKAPAPQVKRFKL